MKIGIIGAGPSGLAFLKELKAAGHDCICYESGSAIGGLFARPYSGARLTSNNYATAFSDFYEDHLDEPIMWRFNEYLAYLEAYTTAFDLRPNIRFNTLVLSVRQSTAGNGLCLQIRMGDAVSEETFDRIAICSGTHRVPVMPTWPGMDTYTGRIMHSADFSKTGPYTGKRVLLVGGGESGSDIALEVARVAEKTWVSIRNHMGHIVSRNDFELSSDRPDVGANGLLTARVVHSLPFWLGPMIARQVDRRRLRKARRLNLPILKKMAEINTAQGSTSLSRFGTKNACLIKAMVECGCKRCPAIRRFSGNKVEFVDGAWVEPEIVLCNTGFATEFTFLDDHFPDVSADARLPRKHLYKHTFHPALGDRIAWGGFARPAFGAIPPISELQARWFALLCTGERTLPTADCMRNIIETDDAVAVSQFSDDARRLPNLTDFLRIMDDLADEIGCLPRGLFWKHPFIWYRVLINPISGVQYRLIGPGSKTEMAIDMLRRTPYKHLTHQRFLLLLLCKVFSMIGLRKFTPAARWI